MEGAPGCHPCREVEKVGGKARGLLPSAPLSRRHVSGPSASQAPEDKAGGLCLLLGDGGRCELSAPKSGRGNGRWGKELSWEVGGLGSRQLWAWLQVCLRVSVSGVPAALGQGCVPIPYASRSSQDRTHGRCPAHHFRVDGYKNVSSFSSERASHFSPLRLPPPLWGGPRGSLTLLTATTQADPSCPNPVLTLKWFVDIALPFRGSQAGPASDLGRGCACEVPGPGPHSLLERQLADGVRSSLKPSSTPQYS